MIYFLVSIFSLVVGVANNENTQVCLQDANKHYERCFDLLTQDFGFVGTACIGLESDNYEPCYSCSSCPCTSFYIDIQTYNHTKWYLTKTSAWIDPELNTVPLNTNGLPVPGIFPYRCHTKSSKSRECRFHIPFDKIYGNYSLKDLCNTYIYTSIFAKTHGCNANRPVNNTAWGFGFPFVEGYLPMFDQTVIRCGSFCKSSPPPPPTPRARPGSRSQSTRHATAPPRRFRRLFPQ